MTSSSDNGVLNAISKSLCFICSSNSDDALIAQQQQIYLGDHLTRSWTRDSRQESQDAPERECHNNRPQQPPISRTRSSLRDSRGNRKNWASKAPLNCVTAEQIQEWKSSFDNLLKSPMGSKLFRMFLSNEIADENLLFWEAVEELRNTKAEKRMQKLSRCIYEDFISVYSPKEINIGYKMREDIVAQLSLTEYADPEVYREAQNLVYSLMLRDSYPRFIVSALAAKEKQEEDKRKCKSPTRTKSRVLCCYGSDPDDDRCSDDVLQTNVVEMKVQISQPSRHDVSVRPPGVVTAADSMQEDGRTDEHSVSGSDMIDPAKIPSKPIEISRNPEDG